MFEEVLVVQERLTSHALADMFEVVRAIIGLSVHKEVRSALATTAHLLVNVQTRVVHIVRHEMNHRHLVRRFAENTEYRVLAVLRLHVIAEEPREVAVHMSFLHVECPLFKPLIVVLAFQ